MKKLLAGLAVFAATLGLAPIASAQSGSVQVEGGGIIATDTETFLLAGRAGYVIDLDTGRRLFVAPEVEGSVGIFGSDDNREADRTIGIFGRAGARLTDQWAVHGRIGYQSIRIREELEEFAISEGNGAIAWGGGVTYFLDQNWLLRGDYTRSDGIGQVGLTVGYRF